MTRLITLGFTIGVLGGPFILCFILPESIQYSLSREGSVIEVASAVFHFLGFALLAKEALREPRIYFLAFPLLMFGLREYDFHWRLTTTGFTRPSFFTNPIVPTFEKYLVLGIYLVLAFHGYKLMIYYFKQFRSQLKERSLYAVLISIGAFLAIFSKTVLDGLERKLAKLHIHHPLTTAQFDWIEETMELSMSIILFSAVLLFVFYPKWGRISLRSSRNSLNTQTHE